MNHEPSSKQSGITTRGAWWRIGRVAVLGLGVFAGLLMWSRLKIVTDTPRSAYAVPHAKATSANPSSAAEDGEGRSQAPVKQADTKSDPPPSENATTP